MGQVRLRVSLSEADLAALDSYARVVGLTSRSAAIRAAIRLIPNPELEDAYGEAWDEWEASGDTQAWELASADGLTDAAR